MNTNVDERENVRDLIRQAIRDVLGDLNTDNGIAFAPRTEDSYHQEVPESRELVLRVRGSERSISALESQIASGEEIALEIAIGKPSGPKVRVQAQR